MGQLQIDPELRDLLGSLSTEEREQLKANILRDGRAIEPIVVWVEMGVIVDGHNRYEICTESDLPYVLHEVSFASKADVIAWMFDHQSGRRNITPERIRYLRGKIYNEEKKGKGGQKANKNAGKNEGAETAHSFSGTAEKVAKQTKSSARTVMDNAKYAAAVDKLDEPVKKAILDKEVKASASDVQKLAKLPKDHHAEIVGWVKAGEAESLGAAIERFELATEEPEEEQPPSIEETLKEQNAAVESFARSLMKFFDEKFPANPWRDFKGIEDSARSGIKSAQNTIRLLKCEICPRCKGDGCDQCRSQGSVPKMLYDQLV